MSVKNFKFVSPGVFINEIDNSFIPRSPDQIGPTVIGRSAKGLAGQPTRIESYSQFVNLFGDTVPGNAGGDVYRDGNFQSPMYGTYAAKAFLNSNVAPVTYVRLLGEQTTAGSAAGTTAAAGWSTDGSPVTASTAQTSNGGAYGLFLFTSSSATSGDLGTGKCAAIWYLQNGIIKLSGSVFGAGTVTASAGAFIGSDTNGNHKVLINGTAQGDETFVFNFDNNSSNFIRNQFNTNPQLRSGNTKTFYPASAQKDYWLGETFEQDVINDGFHTSASIGCIVALGYGTAAAGVGPSKMKTQASREAVAGWFISQDVGVATSYQPANMQKLFRLVGRGHGEWLHKNLKVSIERIRASNTNTSPFGSFSVVLRRIMDSDNKVEVVERFDNCNLNPKSPNFVGRKLGTQYNKWDATNKRLRSYGDYPNLSKYVYVELNADVAAGAMPSNTLLPFGYYGSPVPVKQPFSGSDFGGQGAASNAGAFLCGGTNNLLADKVNTVSRVKFTGSGGPVVSGSVTGAYGDAVTALMARTLNAMSGTFVFPTASLRVNASDGGLKDPTNFILV